MVVSGLIPPRNVCIVGTAGERVGPSYYNAFYHGHSAVATGGNGVGKGLNVVLDRYQCTPTFTTFARLPICSSQFTWAG